MHLGELNALDAESAARELLRCCGSTRWVERMVAARPFLDTPTLADTADRVWWGLDRGDWLEAFAAHPRIGDRGAGGAGRAGGSGRASGGAAGAEQWSAQEQSGVAGAPRDVTERLAIANRDYERRVRGSFLLCATRKTPRDGPGRR